MHVTDKPDGIYLTGHGIVSVGDLVSGHSSIDPICCAPALAKINRYSGNSCNPWNDAEHSVLVARIVPMIASLDMFTTQLTQTSGHFERYYRMSSSERDVFWLAAQHWGYLHDVVEAIVGDKPSPVKHRDRSMSASMSNAEDSEEIIERTLLHAQMSSTAHRLAACIVIRNYALSSATTITEMVRATTEAILDMLRVAVKLADTAALVLEMSKLHPPECANYVVKHWGLDEEYVKFITRIEWPLLDEQAESDTIHWAESARRWKTEVIHSKRRLTQKTRNLLS